MNSLTFTNRAIDHLVINFFAIQSEVVIKIIIKYQQIKIIFK